MTSGQVAIVTGSGQGIGAAIAVCLAESGYAVLVTSRNAQKAEAVCGQLRRAGHQAHAVSADLTEESGVETLFAAADAHFGRVDVLVNNAGLARVGPTLEWTRNAWDNILASNLTSAFLCSQAAAKRMIPQGEGGVIINIASIAGGVGMSGRAAYCSAKHGVIGLTKSLGVEWAKHGIRVCAVAPGYTITPAYESAVVAGTIKEDVLTASTPLGRLGEGKEIGDVVAFLASPGASFVTAAVVPVDGGWSAPGPSGPY